MIEGLPELYSEVELASATEETLEKRSKAIVTIATKRKLDWLLDCVRLYLNKDPRQQTFRAEFVKAFKDDDVMFVDGNNDLELRLLAGAVICEYVSKNKTRHRVLLGMALLTGCFGINPEELTGVSIIVKVRNEMDAVADDLRTGYDAAPAVMPRFDEISSDFPDFTAVSKYLRALKDKFTQFYAEYEVSDKALRHKVNVLSEESQIHWWLFRSFSSTLQTKFEEIEPAAAPMILAYELYMATANAPGPTNASDFLKKAFFDVPELNIESEYTVKDAVDALYNNLDDAISGLDSVIFSTLCPLIYGTLRAIDSSGEDGWQRVFENHTGVDAAYAVSPVEMALQLYNEVLLCWLKKEMKL